MKKKLAILLLIAICLCSVTIPTFNSEAKASNTMVSDNDGTWKHNSTGWWFRYKDGTYAKNTFLTYKDKIYYIKNNGYMATGWKLIDNKWYYFYADGHMAFDEYIKGYYLKADGSMEEDIQYQGYKWIKTGKDNSTWEYQNSYHKLMSGWKKIDGKMYCLYFSQLCTNQYITAPSGGGYYWVNKNGTPITSARLYRITDKPKNSKYIFYGQYKDVKGWVPKNTSYIFDSIYRVYFDKNGKVTKYESLLSTDVVKVKY